jgi:hypothetical protein
MVDPHIIALDSKANIYAAVDHGGRMIGTGTKEVCEFLIGLISLSFAKATERVPAPQIRRTNVRSAINI